MKRAASALLHAVAISDPYNAGTPDASFNSAACREYVEGARAGLKQRLAHESGCGQP